MKPLISIVIPSYNRAYDLKRAIDSIFKQTFSNWEIVIIDNNSEDDTDKVINKINDPRLKMYKINNNGMISASRNMGISHSDGEFVAFLDSDDWWTPNKLDESLKYLNKDVDLVYHDMFIAKKLNQFLYFRKAKTRNLKKPIFQDLLLNGNAINNSSVVVRKNVFDKAGLLPEDKKMNTICDYHAWLHISKHTEKIKRIPKVLGYYWLGGGNTTNLSNTISSLKYFENLYSNEFKAYGEGNNYMCNYIRGRALYKLELYEQAENSLLKIKKKNIPFLIYIKTLWMLYFIKKHTS